MGDIAGDDFLDEAMKTATSLRVGDTIYPIDYHAPPAFKLVRLPKRVLATCPVTVSADIEICQENDDNNYPKCDIEWRIKGSDEVCCREETFVPPASAGGATLVVSVSHPKCTPSILTAPCDVMPWFVEDQFPSERLVSFKSKRDDDVLRVMSFNLLAPNYLKNKEFVASVYPYCETKHLEWEFRFPLIAKEIRDIAPDICCLQEVYETKFNDLYAVFHPDSYMLSFLPKRSIGKFSKTRPEGCALALRKEAFELVDRHDVGLSEELLKGSVGCESWEDHSWTPQVRTVLENVGTVAQICTVRHKRSGKLLVITNTHLFYHPQANHIRLLQVGKLIEIVNDIVEKTGAIPIIAGDLNAQLGTPAIRFLRENDISVDDSVWKLCAEFEWSRSRNIEPEAEFEDRLSKRPKTDGVRMHHNMQLTHCFPDLKWTTLCNGFMGFLDHILVGKGLTPTQALPIPDEDFLKEHYGGLPNRCYGTDHMSVAVDLSF